MHAASHTLLVQNSNNFKCQTTFSIAASFIFYSFHDILWQLNVLTYLAL